MLHNKIKYKLDVHRYKSTNKSTNSRSNYS